MAATVPKLVNTFGEVVSGVSFCELAGRFIGHSQLTATLCTIEIIGW